MPNEMFLPSTNIHKNFCCQDVIYTDALQFIRYKKIVSSI